MDLTKYVEIYDNIRNFLSAYYGNPFILDEAWTANDMDHTLHITGHIDGTRIQVKYDAYTDRLTTYTNFDRFMQNGGANAEEANP